MALSKREQLFIPEYLKDFDGANAWIRAGGSPNGAKQSAMRVKRKPEVAAAIDAAMAARSEKIGVDAEWVLKETVDLYRHSRVLLADEPTAQMISAIKGLLDTIGKHVDVQAFKDKVDHDVTDKLHDLITKSMQPRE